MVLERLLQTGRRTLQVLRDQPVLFVPGLCQAAVGLAFGSGMLGVLSLGQPLALRRIGSAVALGGFVVAVVGLLIDVGQIYWFMLAQRGQRVTWRDFTQGISRFFWRYLGASLLAGLVATVVSMLLFVVFGPLVRSGAGPNLLVLSFLMIPVSLTIGVFLAFWQVSIVRNDSGILEALQGSLDLGRRFFWEVLLVTFLRGLLDGSLTAVRWRNPDSQLSTAFHLPALLTGGVVGAAINVVVTAFFGVFMFDLYEELKTNDG